ncbi:unnamed protein product [Umbelopsis ramanniana]
MAEYTQARVTLWLDANGWSQVSPIFEEKGICGKRFFSLSIADLQELASSGLRLSIGDKRKLLYSIKSILNNDSSNISTENLSSTGQYQSRGSPTSTRNMSYNEFETSRSNSSPEFPISHDPYGYAGSQTLRQRPANHKVNTTFPPTISSSQNATSPRQYGPRPYARADSADPDFNRIKDYIPERTTSTPQHIHHFLEKLNYNLPQRRVPDTIERAAARNLQHLLGGGSHYMAENNNPAFTNPDERSLNHFAASGHTSPPDWMDRLKYRQARRPVPQQEKSLERRIQVTTDADTWFSLIVNDLLDPLTIKEAILARLNINPMEGPFEYIHENGPYPESPLTDVELIHLCRMADRSASNRILVRALNPQANQDIMASPVGGQFAISSNELWAISPSSPNGAHQRTNSDNYANSSKSPSMAAPSLWAIQPKKSVSTSLWATPPSSEPSSLGTKSGSGDSPRPLDGPTTPSKPVSFWATPPSSSYSDKRSDDEIFPMSAGGMNPTMNGNGLSANGMEQSSAVEAAVESLSLKSPRKDKKLQIQIPSIVANTSADSETSKSDYSPRQSPYMGSSTPTHQARRSSSSESSATTYDPFQPDRSEGHLKPPPPNVNEFWGERPPLEVITQNPDMYFDEQNLDREIIVDPPPPPSPANNTRRPGANLVYRKSVRIKIQETHKPNRWQQAHNVLRANNILRRKSTKVWGQKVVQVKPGMSIDDAPTPIKDEKTEVSTLPAPTKILYMMGKLIGKGSFGRVYHAVMVNLNGEPVEVIAIKQVEIPTTKSDLMNVHQRASIEALYHEISLLEGLDHENIVQYLGYDSDEAEGHLNIFLEYVAGGSITSCLTKFGPFQEPLVGHFTRQILQGLRYLHNKHILHRDIKGGNILVQEDGTCKISDFGLSKLNDQDEVYDQNSKMSLQGSIFWMAPEVVKNEPYSAKVDIWSLGCTVIEMYTGKRPWLDMTALAAVYSIGTCKSPPIPEDMSDDAKDFLRQCFIIDPALRPTATILLSHPFCQMDPNFVFKNYIVTGPK